MKEEIQIIERDGKPEWAILPYEDYLQLVEQAELLEDIRDFDEISARIARGEEELIPAKVVDAIAGLRSLLLIFSHERGLLLLHAGDIQSIHRTVLDVLSDDAPAARGGGCVVALGRLNNHPAFGELLQGKVHVGWRVLRVDETVEHQRA